MASRNGISVKVKPNSDRTELIYIFNLKRVPLLKVEHLFNRLGSPIVMIRVSDRQQVPIVEALSVLEGAKK